MDGPHNNGQQTRGAAILPVKERNEYRRNCEFGLSKVAACIMSDCS